MRNTMLAIVIAAAFGALAGAGATYVGKHNVWDIAARVFHVRFEGVR